MKGLGKDRFVILGALFVLFSAILGYAVVTIIVPTFTEATNQTGTYINFNVSSSNQINVSGNNFTVLEWTNQSGQALNITPTEVVNATLNYSFWNISSMLEGVHHFKAYISEYNVTTTTTNVTVTETRNVTIDTTAPVIVTNTQNLTNFSSSVTLNFSVIDSVFTRDIWYRVYIDSVNITENPANATNNTRIITNLTGGLSNGTHILTITGKDALNNAANSTPMNFMVDTEAPTVAAVFTNDGTAANSSGTIQVNVTVTDNGFAQDIAYKIFLGNANLTEPGISNVTNNSLMMFNVTGIVNGTNTIRAEVRDAAGNVRNSSAITATGSTSPPYITFNVTNGLNSTNSSVQLNFTIISSSYTTDLPYKVGMDSLNITQIGGTAGSPNATNNTYVQINLTNVNGTHVFNVETRDAAGNIANSSTITLNINATPTISFANPNLANTSSTTPTLNFTLTSTAAQAIGYKIFIDNASGAINNFTGIANVTNGTNVAYASPPLPNGTFMFKIETRDVFGNIANSSNVTVIIDTAAPNVAISTSNATSTTDTTPDISFTVTDNFFTQDIGYKIYVDGAVNSQAGTNATNNTQATFTLSALSVAAHTVFVEVRDAANNARNSTALTITITSSSSGSGSSSSSGGGGGAVTNTTTTNTTANTTAPSQPPAASSPAITTTGFVVAKIYIATVIANENNNIDLSHTSVNVKEINFVLSKDASEIEITISRLDSYATPAAGMVYQYIEIDHANLSSSDVKFATISFNVSSQWIISNGFNNSDVFLQRYDNAVWTRLSTINVTESTDEVQFQASSPGMSVFAISAEKASASVQQQDSQSSQGSQPSQEKKPESLDLWIILTVIVVALAAIMELKYKSIFKGNDLYEPAKSKKENIKLEISARIEEDNKKRKQKMVAAAIAVLIVITIILIALDRSATGPS